jgi:uncharacterized protein (DUF488 family)
MKLQKQLSRLFKGKEYVKWIITIPPEDIEKLKWQEGEELGSEVDGNRLILKKTIKYEEFKEKLLQLLSTRDYGFTWQEIKRQLKLQQAVPNNKWVANLEKEVGLKRRQEGNVIYWYLDKQGITIFTIGYEGRKLNDLINVLKKHKIEQLVDVRELALSRKNGFAKSALKEALNQNSIIYKHFSELGSPRELRHKLWNEGNYAEFFKDYSEWLTKPEAKEYLTDLEGLAHVRTTVIMCFEHDVEKCHRSIIKKRLIQDGFKVVDL